ncbi:hypothetical protein FGG08_002960 [Glutinoglossum americanum]|uniref:Betaine lipid synthase n=1 Tax=Glutinoglossum americanum TaxID=1670608 RepID=A0A9P8I3K1_9PEZI|nr:hypothetical protein FGG08_002960 [Glutinoglossum americanum]
MSSPIIATFLPLGMLPRDPHLQIVIVAALVALLVIATFAVALLKWTDYCGSPHTLFSYLRFFYASFLKPHAGDGFGGNQQDALESFYRAQAGAYDATRKVLLRGREDMLGLVAAQLKFRAKYGDSSHTRRIWIDIGGGTGYNIEAMSSYLPVTEFFSSVYLIDLSPSLCEVARRRFAGLGWANVKVICQDARSFRLEDHETGMGNNGSVRSSRSKGYFGNEAASIGGADLLTLSYSLSMIPDYYSVVDAMSSLLSPYGILGVADFYVQSGIDLAGRNYTGGVFNRHVNWLGRVFWRAWFEIDRVGLEPSRRDYLEYRFGTILSVDDRNYMVGGIPYYIWVGCQRKPVSSLPDHPHEIVERLDAAVTESPYLSPVNHTNTLSRKVSSSTPEIRSKAFNAAILNLTANLPLPSFFYQNHHWRIHYDEQLRKHTQFKNEYIYAFTWEDPRVDLRILKLGSDDVVLAVTSAGDNILAYALEGPKRIHAVDLNPTQNHLLELKVAAFTALGYADVWKLFGEGKHAGFRDLLVSELSPHMSSRALQYWLDTAGVFTSRTGNGLYETGGSRYAIKLVKWLFTSLIPSAEIRKLCGAKTLNEQREIWHSRVRKVLLSRVLSWAVIGNEMFLWKALGVPRQQRNMIQRDYYEQDELAGTWQAKTDITGQAIWEYLVNTLDPVVENTLISEDNYFYLLCLQGKYSRRCHPVYLTPRAHVRLSRLDAFDGLRIHTDEISEVMSRITPGTLTVAVIMDSMDWFDTASVEASVQISATNRALKLGGRVLLRSAGLKPWYIQEFETRGFTAQRVNARLAGTCVDRVNMYASTWLCVKTRDLPAPQVPTPTEHITPVDLRAAATSPTADVTHDASIVEKLEL